MISQIYKKDFILGLISQFFAIFIYYISLSFPVAERGFAGPSSFPKFISYLIFILGTIIMIKAVLDKNADKISFSVNNLKELVQVGILCLLFIIYLWGLKYFYFIPITIVFLLVLILLVRKSIKFNPKQYFQMILFSVLTSVILYFVFVSILNIYLK